MGDLRSRCRNELGCNGKDRTHADLRLKRYETGALMHGLVMPYLGGRVAMPPESFRAFCHWSFGRYVNGIRS
jgi:hypothetical protein